MATARSRPRSIPTATSYSLEPLRGPNGVTRPLKKEVVVDAGLEGAQLIKTTIHELAHVLMHARDGHIDCRGRVEVEAESVACVAGWAERSSDPERTLLATEERVVSYSRRVLDDFKRFHSFLGTVSDYSSTSYVVRAQKDSLRGGSPGQAPVRSVFPDS